MEALDKTERMNELLDAYGSLLTDKQLDILKLYYEEDFSLSEIAELQQISRAAVSDHLKRSEKVLDEYEAKLKIVFGNQQRRMLYEAMRALDNQKINQYINALEAIDNQEDIMTKIISVNAGSSSLKFQLFEMPQEQVLTSGNVERIGLEEGIFTIKVNGEKVTKKLPIEDHAKAVALLMNALVEHKIVSSLEEIKGVGHRVVQGGDYSSSRVIDDTVEQVIVDMSELAPLHNPAGLVGYRAFKEALPNAGHVAVFDTAFHQTMGQESYLYPVPMSWYRDYKIRRYGYHGTSHQYVSQRCAELMNKNIKDLKIITCHLGNGASISAVDGGKCINTSMGFTPLAGIMMGTRCGDIDPAIVCYMMKKTGMSAEEMDTVLNKESGMLGISGISSDARDIEKACEEGKEGAIIATNLYVNRIINTVGGYFAQLGGVDAIVFAGGIGENDHKIRRLVCEKLESALGVKIDKELNAQTRGVEKQLSTEDSKVSVWLIPTNEELVIARDTYQLLGF